MDILKDYWATGLDAESTKKRIETPILKSTKRAMR